jgi:hypothetical protein
MTQQYRAPEPQGDDWKSWARRMMLYLGQTRSPLVQQTGGESAAEDGVLMWDRTNLYPVVSKNGEWRQVVLEDGHADFILTSDVTPVAANTAYKLTYDAPSGNDGITQGTPASRIVFDEAGQYVVSFSGANIIHVSKHRPLLLLAKRQRNKRGRQRHDHCAAPEQRHAGHVAHADIHRGGE